MWNFTITTAHGATLADLENRPILKQLINSNIFDRYVFLGRTLGPGTVETILDGKTKQNILLQPIQTLKRGSNLLRFLRDIGCCGALCGAYLLQNYKQRPLS